MNITNPKPLHTCTQTKSLKRKFKSGPAVTNSSKSCRFDLAKHFVGEDDEYPYVCMECEVSTSDFSLFIFGHPWSTMLSAVWEYNSNPVRSEL